MSTRASARATSSSSRRSTQSAAATSKVSRGCSTSTPSSSGEVHTGAWTTLLEAIAQPDVVGDDLETELGVDPRVVELLIERGSSLDVPLNLAACFNRSELVGMLLAAGADPDGARDLGDHAAPDRRLPRLGRGGRPARGGGARSGRAVRRRRDGRLDELARWFDPGGALRPEAFANRPNLADVGWPPAPPPRDDPQEVLDEAFALAAFSGRLAALEWLLGRGARVDGRAHGLAALHFAIIRGRLDVVRLALDRGADLAVRDAIHSRTPVGWAGGEARRGGGDRLAIRDLLVERSDAPAAGDLALAFERAWAAWGERGEAVLDSGLTLRRHRSGARARLEARGPLLVHRRRRRVRRAGQPGRLARGRRRDRRGVSP